MKKYDVGITEKEKYGDDAPVSTKARQNRIIRPSLDLNLSQLPPLKGKDFGDEFTIMADVRIKSVEKDNKRVRYGIEFVKIAMKGEEPVKKLTW